MNGIESLASNPIISAIVAAGLYFITYLSFVRLLRYWRNWYRPPHSASLLTVTLAIATVMYVALLPHGLSLQTLSLVAGFMVLLFSLIAAPAIAFEPGPPRHVIEFLAKYGQFSGVWMILPAIGLGFLLPDAKVFGLLAAVVAIELTWFFRLRGSTRQTHAFDADDLLVLKTQANDNVKTFVKKHAITEFKMAPDGSASWVGCNKGSLPCPINHYIHRLGLNTPPCCHEHIADLGMFVTRSLRDLGAVHWIDGGTLLGAVRENGALLAWEDDIDISVMLDDDMTWSKLCSAMSIAGAKQGYYIDIFEEQGFITVSFDRPQSWPFRWERNRMRGEIRLDLVPFRHNVNDGQPVLERQLLKGAMPVMQSGWHGVPVEVVLPTATVNFLGSDVPCPNQPELFLQILYGDYQKVELTYVDENAAKASRQKPES